MAQTQTQIMNQIDPAVKKMIDEILSANGKSLGRPW